MRLSQALILRVTDMFVYCNYSDTKNYFCDDLLMLNVGPSIKQSIHYLLLFPVKYMNTFGLFCLCINHTHSCLLISLGRFLLQTYQCQYTVLTLNLFFSNSFPQLSHCQLAFVLSFLRVRQRPCRKSLEFSFFTIIIHFLHTKTLIKAKVRPGCGFKVLLRPQT